MLMKNKRGKIVSKRVSGKAARFPLFLNLCVGCPTHSFVTENRHQLRRSLYYVWMLYDAAFD